jgi:pantoate--beta-alanine ligase
LPRWNGERLVPAARSFSKASTQLDRHTYFPVMQTVRSVASMQRLALQLKKRGVAIGFVPTMGYLHEGHISLVHQARKRVGPGGRVIVSIFVNPTQFAPHEDLAKYPRDLPRDTQLCREAGADILFAPSDRDIYPPGYSTYVAEEKLSRVMEGASRPTHFRGVTTVVAKLFNIVLPDVAVFGAKDFQQATIIGRMVRDLNFPLKIVVSQTVRESDGLAMSSRNKYLSPDERKQALVLSTCIRETRRALKQRGPVLQAGAEKKRLAGLIRQHPSARLDYVEFFDPVTLEPTEQIRKGVQMALAVFMGKTRLIDNGRL